MQLFGWFEFGIVPDLDQLIFPLYVHYCSNQCHLQFFVLALHRTLISPHSTFLALEGQRNFPLSHYPRKLLFWTCFERFYFFLMFFFLCYFVCAFIGSIEYMCCFFL